MKVCFTNPLQWWLTYPSCTCEEGVLTYLGSYSTGLGQLILCRGDEEVFVEVCFVSLACIFRENTRRSSGKIELQFFCRGRLIYPSYRCGRAVLTCVWECFFRKWYPKVKQLNVWIAISLQGMMNSFMYLWRGSLAFWHVSGSFIQLDWVSWHFVRRWGSSVEVCLRLRIECMQSCIKSMAARRTVVSHVKWWWRAKLERNQIWHVHCHHKSLLTHLLNTCLVVCEGILRAGYHDLRWNLISEWPGSL